MGKDKKKTLILVDGHALAFRQYFALERTNMHTTDNRPTWAVYGFFKALFDILQDKNIKPDSIAVAFDLSHQTFRVEKYSEYKSNRQTMPTPMQSQMKLIYEGLNAFNIPIYTKENFEADDIIGTITQKAEEEGHKTFILTGDQDSFQLVDKKGLTKVLLPTPKGLKEYGWNEVKEKFGVYPNQVVDYKALCGDTSDNIPGIRGIGKVSAAKLLNEFDNLENIIKNTEKITQKALKEKLIVGVEDAKLSQYLATIVRNVDINFDFNSAKIEMPNIDEVTKYLQDMQFYTFIKKSNEILNLFDNTKDDKKNSELLILKQDSPAQLGLFSNSVVQKNINNDCAEFEKFEVKTLEDLQKYINEVKNQEYIGIFFDYTMKNAVEIYFRGFAFSYCIDGKGKSVYVAFDELSKKDVLKMFKEIFESSDIKKSFYNVKELYNVLKSERISLKGVHFDNLLASYIKDTSRNHDLNFQALENLKRYEIDKLDENSYNSRYHYSTDNAYVIYELTEYWTKKLSTKELKLLYEVEIPLSEVLADMERTGVFIDKDYLSFLTNDMASKMKILEDEIFALAECKFNLNSPRQVGDVFYNKLKMTTKKRGAKSKLSTSAPILEDLAQRYVIAEKLIAYRAFAKLKSTYTDNLPKLISDVDGRIHTTYNQIGAVTGRISSLNPNLQNIPTRSEDGNKIRAAFVVKNSDDILVSADYSQVELRLLAHVSKDETLIEAFKSGDDVHAITASHVFGVNLSDVTREMRRKAKAVNFGIVYGQTKYGLAKSLGITNDEAQDFIDKYFKTYPKIKEYMEREVAFADKHGYVETFLGRKRYLKNELQSSNFNIREFAHRAAINQPLQGAAADLIKMAMDDLYAKLKKNNLKSKMIMQVHDELVLEVKEYEVEMVKQLLKESMENVATLSVPLIVDIKQGKNWKE